jgi:hypothetical protein
MRWILAPAWMAVAMLATSASAERRPMLYDPVALNIGVNCQWQSQCMAKQRAAMKRALHFVDNHRPPHRRVEMCNRNAARGGYRVDWIGFDNCIRNASLRVTRPRKRERSRAIS